MKHTIVELKAILRTLKNAKDLDVETIAELKVLPRRPYDLSKKFPYWPYTEDGIRFPSSTTIWTDFEKQMYKKYRNGESMVENKNIEKAPNHVQTQSHEQINWSKKSYTPTVSVKSQKLIQELLNDREYVKSKYSNLFFPDIPVIPIPFFGNITTAKVITVGVNPSSTEIRNNGWQKSMSAEEINYKLSNYFNDNPHDWFLLWEDALNKIDISYKDGSAAHVDLCSWATKSMGKLTGEILSYKFETLIKKSIKYFWETIELCTNAKLILMAGSSGIGNEGVNESIANYGYSDEHRLICYGKNSASPCLNENKIMLNVKSLPAFFNTTSPSSRTEDQKENLIKAINNNKEKLKRILM